MQPAVSKGAPHRRRTRERLKSFAEVSPPVQCAGLTCINVPAAMRFHAILFFFTKVVRNGLIVLGFGGHGTIRPRRRRNRRQPTMRNANGRLMR